MTVLRGKLLAARGGWRGGLVLHHHIAAPVWGEFRVGGKTRHETRFIPQHSLLYHIVLYYLAFCVFVCLFVLLIDCIYHIFED